MNAVLLKRGSHKLLQLEDLLLNHVLYSARRAHHDIHAPPQSILLGSIRTASINARALVVESLAH